MPSTIRVDTGFRSRRGDVGAAMDRALPHRGAYLGFALGFLATVIVAMAGIVWWAVQSGYVYIQFNF